MRLKQDLYSVRPPSLERESLPFIPAEVNKFWQIGTDIVFKHLLKGKFAAVRIKNRHLLKKRDKTKPVIIYAPHICWWDGILAYFLCRQIFGLDMRFMVEELHLLPMMRKFGAFSIDKKSPKSILKSLNFAVNHLNSPQKVFYIYPQGIIRPQDYSPIEFGSGITYIASNLAGVNLIPLCIRYCFLRNTSPEILVEVKKPMLVDKVENRNEMTAHLEKHFEEALENQRLEIADGNLKNYITVLQKNDNMFRKFEKNLKNNL
ncbi:MAG: lysophospholipid acyltransferase family protein [bacterium]